MYFLDALASLDFKLSVSEYSNETLPKAQRTQALNALTSNSGLLLLVWFGSFGSVSLVG